MFTINGHVIPSWHEYEEVYFIFNNGNWVKRGKPAKVLPETLVVRTDLSQGDFAKWLWDNGYKYTGQLMPSKGGVYETWQNWDYPPLPSSGEDELF